MLIFRRAFERLDSQEGERMCTIPKIISTGVLRKNGLQIKGIPGQVMTSTLKNKTRGKDNRDDRKLADPLGATQMGLVYVNPEGPNGTPDPLLAARDIRTTFGRMGMNDYETVALVAGGHTFGKSHGAAVPTGNIGPSPEGSTISDMGLGWANSYGSGRGEHTITSGLEGAWTKNPVKWDDGFFHNLLGRGFRWVRTKGPGGAVQWTPEGDAGSEDVPDAHKPSIRVCLFLSTVDTIYICVNIIILSLPFPFLT